jgi:hypothetical protein
MADESTTASIHEISYLRLFPWLRLFRCPAVAADPKALMLAALGLLLLAGGWELLDRVFPESSGLTPEVFEAREVIGPENLRSVPWWLTEPLRLVTAPFFAAFNPPSDRWAFPHAALAALWSLVVWGLIGGAIARVAVVRLVRGERVGLREAVGFAARKAVPLIGTPLIPLFGVALVTSLVAVFGLLYRLPDPFGATVAGVLAFLPLIGGLMLTLILIGLMVGWPLMQASIAAEAEDGFDAMSRIYAYVHQRPWHYGAYAVLAFAIGCVGLVFVDVFARLVVHLAGWSLSFGGPGTTVWAFFGRGGPDAPPPDLGSHRFWLGCVALLVRAWVFSAFWTASTVIYLLLRRDVDGTPWSTIAYESKPSVLTGTADGATPPAEPSPAVPSPHVPGPRDESAAPGVL